MDMEYEIELPVRPHKKKIILVDQDDVLADFEGGFLKVWRKRYPNRPYVPLDKRTQYETIKDYNPEFAKDIFAIRAERGFFLNLEPKPKGLKALEEGLALGHIMRICTAPIDDFEFCVKEKFEWVKKWLGKEWVKRIILMKDKTLVRGSYLIDDKPEITGECEPLWEHAVFDMPYNQESKARFRVTWDNWKQILWL